MVTDDDLSYYFDVVKTLWLGGTNPTFARIWDRVRPTERDTSRLAHGLGALVARNWLKVEQVAVGVWDPDTIYETWYVPIRDHRRSAKATALSP